jgi:ketosteroid isomerase-like protein
MVADPADTLARLHAAQQQFYAGGGDAPLRELLCPDIAWHVPGASAIAGSYRGIDAVLAYFARRRDLADRTFRMQPAELLSGDGEHVAMLTHGHATIDGRAHAWSTIGLYRLRGGRVAECRLLPFDQAQFDRIWTRARRDAAIYDQVGSGYAQRRRPDPRVAGAIRAGLGDARTVVNVGAGAGAYEPADRCLIAVEPSSVMIAQRPPGSAPAVVASAGALPLADATVDAAMATLTLHHWPDWRAGVAEMRRVARQRIVLFTWDKRHGGFWLTEDYLGWLADWDATRFPAMEELLAELPGATATAVPVPGDCTDGFLAAYFARPEAYLDPAVRGGMSLFTLAPDPERVDASLRVLADDLRSGAWDARHGALRHTAAIDAGYRLVVAEL